MNIAKFPGIFLPLFERNAIPEANNVSRINANPKNPTEIQNVVPLFAGSVRKYINTAETAAIKSMIKKILNT